MEIINYDTLFEQYAGIAFEKQYSLADVIGDSDWNVDTTTGLIAFGEIEMPIQVLGTYSFQSETWLWAWANQASGIPENLLTQANELKKLGEEYNIEFLTKDQYKIEATDAHALGIIASGKFGSSAYYAGNFGDGIVLVTVESSLIDQMGYNEQARILQSFPQLISAFGINHRRTLRNYLEAKGYTVGEKQKEMTAVKGENSIFASFDPSDRLTNLKGETSPTPREGEVK